jgi:hypothetical protein
MSVFKNFNIKTEHLLIVVGGIVLVYFLMNYSIGKNMLKDNMDNYDHNHNHNHNIIDNESNQSQLKPNNLLGKNDQFAPVNENSAQTQGLQPDCGGNVADPSELLPNDQNNEWARLNPNGENDLKNINLLKAGFHHGIDTIGTTLRNANLQLRSEPPNPQDKVSPWMNSTIEPDLMRTPLELGCGNQ